MTNEFELVSEASLGLYIAEKRKEQGLTQKDLAEQLHVTDKAVSKWERGLSYPDITLIPKIASLFSVSTEALLYGGNTAEIAPEIKTAVLLQKILNPAQMIKRKRLAFVIVALSLIVATIVCFIVDIALNGNQLTWSYLVLGGCLLVFCVTLPALMLESRVKSVLILLVSAVGAFLYCLLVEHFSPMKGWAINLALPIILLAGSASLLYLLVMEKFRPHLNKLFQSAISLFLYGVIMAPGIQLIVRHYLISIQYEAPSLLPALIIFGTSFTFCTSFLLMGFILEGKKKAL